MNVFLRLSLLVALLVSIAGASRVEAQADPARAAEAARRRGDNERARRLAREALEQGTSEPAHAAALHRVVGLASAALGDDDSAREAFTRLLGISPEVRLDADLPAELRSPYLEARGFWTGTTERLGVEVSLDEESLSVRASAVDPARMAFRYRLRVRSSGGPWREVARAPDEAITIELPELAATRAVEYSVAILDELGNRIYRRGSDDAPERLELPRREAVSGGALGGVGPTVARVADPTPFYVTGVTLAVAGAGLLVGGGVSTVEAIRLQDEWNSDACLGGAPQFSTRAETCPGIDESARTNQTVAYVMYGVGAAALVAGIVMLAIAPSGTSAPPPAADEDRDPDVPSAAGATLDCGAGPGEIGLACGVSL